MTRLRSVGRWMTDWRNGATLVASLITVVVLLTTMDAIAGRREAFDQLRSSRAAASRRIDLLQARIDELEGEGRADSAEVAELAVQVDVLRRQVEGLGATPIVAAPRPAAGAAGSTPTTGPPPATPTSTTTTAPPGPAGTSPPTTQPTPDPGPGAPPAPPPDDRPAVCQLLAVPVICN